MMKGKSKTIEDEITPVEENTEKTVNKDTENDLKIALMLQALELKGSGHDMNDQELDNFESEYVNYIANNDNNNNNNNRTNNDNDNNNETNNNTENDELIARLWQESFIYEQKLYNFLEKSGFYLNTNSTPFSIPTPTPTPTPSQTLKSTSVSTSSSIQTPTSISTSTSISTINSKEFDGREYISSEVQKQKYKENEERIQHINFRNKLKSKEASKIYENIKNFIKEFKSINLNPEEQKQNVRNFLMDISRELMENPLWINCDNKEKENAITELEKLVAKNLFKYIFSPEVDKTNDKKYCQIVHLHSWVEPKHCNLPDFDFHILEEAGNKLSQMNLHMFYKDKINCIVNCINLIKRAYQQNISKEELTDDTLISLIIFTLLKTNPEKLHLISNFEYIIRYVNPNYLNIEICKNSMLYLMHSIKCIDVLSEKSFNISPEEYYTKIEMAKKEKHDESMMELDRSSNSSNSIIRNIVDYTSKFFSGNESDNSSQGSIFDIDRSFSFSSFSRAGSSISSRSSGSFMRDQLNAKRQEEPLVINVDKRNLFGTSFTEEDENNLYEADRGLKSKLSISSSKYNFRNNED